MEENKVNAIINFLLDQCNAEDQSVVKTDINAGIDYQKWNEALREYDKYFQKRKITLKAEPNYKLLFSKIKTRISI